VQVQLRRQSQTCRTPEKVGKPREVQGGRNGLRRERVEWEIVFCIRWRVGEVELGNYSTIVHREVTILISHPSPT